MRLVLVIVMVMYAVDTAVIGCLFSSRSEHCCLYDSCATADPTLLLDETCHKVLVKHCMALSLAASPVDLTPAHMEALCSLTKLKVLEMESNMPYRQSPSDSYPDLPQD